MTTPIISMGGTNATNLIETICTATDALQTAIDAVKATAPNGRDYTTETMRSAVLEFKARMDSLLKIHADLQALAIAIDETR